MKSTYRIKLRYLKAPQIAHAVLSLLILGLDPEHISHSTHLGIPAYKTLSRHAFGKKGHISLGKTPKLLQSPDSPYSSSWPIQIQTSSLAKLQIQIISPAQSQLKITSPA